MSNFSGTADDNGRKFHEFDGHKKKFQKSGERSRSRFENHKDKEHAAGFRERNEGRQERPARFGDDKRFERNERNGRSDKNDRAKEKESAPSRLICWKSAIWTAALSN